MSTVTPPWKIWSAFAVVLVLSVVSMTADRFQILSGFRTAAHDFLSPGRMVVASLSGMENTTQRSLATISDDPRMTQLEQQLESLESQRRQLLIENARLNNELRLAGQLPEAVMPRDSLAGFEVIPARVLSRHGMPPALQQLFIDAGRAHGMKRSELVLDSNGLLLDEGAQSGVTSSHQVLLGRTVLGRIERAGRWVSEVLPVTDPQFSVRVRLMRPTPSPLSEPVIGLTEGILEGTGTGCRIAGIPYTDSVAVGDEVFSADINGMSGPKLYFGRVVDARFESGGEWTVLVRPGAAAEQVRSVSILRPTLNSSKIQPISLTRSEP